MKFLDNMAKISLLTIHWGNSYGAVLQTYATVKILKNLGHDTIVINLIPKRFKNRIWTINYYLRLHFIKDFQFFLFKKKYFKKMSKVVTSLSEIEMADYDYIVIGSDQVWNENITKENFDDFFLPFKTKAKKISLASSFGIDTFDDIPNDKLAFMKNALSDFLAISVRENSGVQFLTSKLNINAQQLCDPTLAYADFDDFTQGKEKNNMLYPFLLDKTKEKISIIELISKELNLPIFNYNFIRRKFIASPVQWLKRIKSSKAIVTDSFHGLAFSILCHKDVYILPTKVSSQFTRLQSLLALVGLEYRYVESVEYLREQKQVIFMPINYSNVDSILLKERTKFYSFIKKNIK